MGINLTPVQAPAEAVKEVSGLIRDCIDLLKQWLAGADVRRMKACIEAGERYIFINEMKDYPNKERDLKEQRERFFKFN